MKILYIHQYFNSDTMPGSTRSYEFAKRLVSRGDTVYMVTTNWQGESDSSYELIDGIHVFWAPIRYSNKMSYINRLFVFIKFIYYCLSISAKLKYDLIIASSTPLTVAIPAIILKRIKKVKLIFEIRDLWPDLPIAIGAIKSKLFINITKWFEKMTYMNSNHIICLSPGMKRKLQLDIAEYKITVITNLSDTNSFRKKDKKNGLIENFPKIINNPIIVYTGSFGRINGLLYLLQIAKELNKINSNINFLLVGDGYDKDRIIHYAKKYGLLNKTFYHLGYLPKSQMPNLLSMATIVTSFFVDLPEMENNSANKFFDGLAAGKPIMLNYKGWQADLLIDSGAGFIIPSNNPTSAANKINDIINDDSLLIKMSRASYNLASEFDIDTNYKKFEKVIDYIYTS